MTRDDSTDDVLSQVRKALEELELGSPATRDALVDGVREALGTVTSALRDDSRDDPHTDGWPDLRVVPDDTEDDGDDPTSKVHLRFVSPGLDEPIQEDWLGILRVPGGAADEVEAWQTVSYAPQPRAYRIRCGAGALEIVADDQPIARVFTGQSVDIEARTIRVRGLDGPAHGTYDRL